MEEDTVRCRIKGCGNVRTNTIFCLCDEHQIEFEAGANDLRVRPDLKKQSFVYAVITLDMDNERVKFGFSSDPVRRMYTMRTDSPVKIGLGAYVDGDLELERSIHRYCSDHRVHGEWFDLVGRAEKVFNLMKDKDIHGLAKILTP